MALRDPAASQLDHEAVRLAALLEGARAESRASGVAVRFELVNEPPAEQSFRFVGLPSAEPLPTRWLAEGVSADDLRNIAAATLEVTSPPSRASATISLAGAPSSLAGSSITTSKMGSPVRKYNAI